MKWHRCTSAGVSLSTCEAPDLREARRILKWTPGDVGYVQSDASHRVPHHRATDRAERERKAGRDYRQRSGDTVHAAKERSRAWRQVQARQANQHKGA